ncbi:hypothetical protein STEG23_021885 [Scotinomys teguina]
MLDAGTADQGRILQRTTLDSTSPLQDPANNSPLLIVGLDGLSFGAKGLLKPPTIVASINLWFYIQQCLFYKSQIHLKLEKGISECLEPSGSIRDTRRPEGKAVAFLLPDLVSCCESSETENNGPTSVFTDSESSETENNGPTSVFTDILACTYDFCHELKLLEIFPRSWYNAAVSAFGLASLQDQEMKETLSLEITQQPGFCYSDRKRTKTVDAYCPTMDQEME